MAKPTKHAAEAARPSGGAFDKVMPLGRGSDRPDTDSPLAVAREIVRQLNAGELKSGMNWFDELKVVIGQRGLFIAETLSWDREVPYDWEFAGFQLVLAASKKKPAFAVILLRNPRRKQAFAELWLLDAD